MSDFRLVGEGADVNRRHPLGWTALHVASVNGKANAVVALLEAGADPNLGDEFINVQRTAIEKGLHAIHGKTVEVPVGRPSTGEPVLSFYRFPVLEEREEEFSSLLNNKATFQGFTALHYAVLADDAEVVRVLLEGGADPIRENDAGHRPVDYAREGKAKVLLVKHSLKVIFVPSFSRIRSSRIRDFSVSFISFLDFPFSSLKKRKRKGRRTKGVDSL